MKTEDFDLFQLEQTLWILEAKTNQAIYDFSFSQFFDCRRPFYRPEKVVAIARVGAIDYDNHYSSLHNDGIQLIHTPEQHNRASLLPE